MSQIDAHTAIRRAIQHAEAAERSLERLTNPDPADLALLAQAWSAIAQELTYQEVQLPGAWEAIDQAERGDP